MIGTPTKPKIKDEIKVERPRLHKVILVNDDFTPREFVVMVLKAEFRMSENQALRVMMTAHRRGACVVAVYTKDVAEAKATNATDAGRRRGYPPVVHDRAGGIGPLSPYPRSSSKLRTRVVVACGSVPMARLWG
jgi:ATP-dependent Clp protease adaptor protein ClpS